MKSLILILACLLLVTPCQSAENQSGQTKQIEQPSALRLRLEERLKIQQQRLKDIEELVASEQQSIEEWYARSLRELVESTASQLKATDRVLWAEFKSKMTGEMPYANNYFWSKFPKTVSILQDKREVRVGQALKVFGLREAMIDSFFMSLAQDFLTNDNFRKMLSEIVDSETQNLLIRTEAQKLLTIMKDLELRTRHLQNRRDAQLAQLEQWEKGLREHVHGIMREIKALPEMTELGVVSAISCDEKGSLCIVDGVDKVLQPGDMIGNITVVKIDKKQVEFAKGSQKWVQAIGQPANPAWK